MIYGFGTSKRLIYTCHQVAHFHGHRVHIYTIHIMHVDTSLGKIRYLQFDTHTHTHGVNNSPRGLLMSVRTEEPVQSDIITKKKKKKKKKKWEKNDVGLVLIQVDSITGSYRMDRGS